MGIFNFFKKNALSSGQVVSQLYELVESQTDMVGDYWYLTDLYEDESGRFAIFSYNGRLVKVEYSVSGGNVNLISKEFVQVEFTPVSNSEIRVSRSSDGKSAVWYGVIASAVLNRNSEIDTTKLFDYFENNYKKNEAYVTFHHLSKDTFAFGEVASVYRYNELLIGMGTIDLTTKLGLSAVERLASGEWGFSIGFRTNEGVLVDVGEGVKIRTFEVGKLVEVSILRKEHAANYFTEANIKERDYNMAERKVLQERLAEFLGDENEAETLLNKVDDISRNIKDSKLVSRSNEETKEEEKEKDMQLTDENIVSITQAVSEIFEEKYGAKITELTTAISQSSAKIDALETRAAKQDENELDKPASRNSAAGTRPTQRENEDGDVTTLNLKQRMSAALDATKLTTKA